MTEMVKKSKKPIVIGVVIATILLLAGGFLFYFYHRPGGINGNEATITGKVVCLPKKGDGPQTLECAFGVQSTNDGKYYGMRGLSGPDANSAFSKTVSITGPLSEPEVNTPYDTAGTVDVKSFVVGQ